MLTTEEVHESIVEMVRGDDGDWDDDSGRDQREDIARDLYQKRQKNLAVQCYRVECSSLMIIQSQYTKDAT